MKRIVPAVVASVAVVALASPPPAQAARTPVRNLPRGLYCRDFKRAGYPYAQAVQYWYWWGRPANMDADLDGIPCETVYSAQEVENYWG